MYALIKLMGRKYIVHIRLCICAYISGGYIEGPPQYNKFHNPVCNQVQLNIYSGLHASTGKPDLILY